MFLTNHVAVSSSRTCSRVDWEKLYSSKLKVRLTEDTERKGFFVAFFFLIKNIINIKINDHEISENFLGTSLDLQKQDQGCSTHLSPTQRKTWPAI